MRIDPVTADENRYIARMEEAEDRAAQLAELVEEETESLESEELPEDFAILIAEQMGMVEQTIFRDLILAYEGPELARFLAPYAKRVIEQAARERAKERMKELEGERYGR